MDKYLTIIICNKGYSTDVITVARNHGAKGGTVLDGRGTANDQDMMFFQKYIQREKEVIFSRRKKFEIDPGGNQRSIKNIKNKNKSLSPIFREN